MEEKVIFLSPSTQEFNVGYGDFGTEEYRMNRIADIVEQLLKSQGYTVYRNDPNEKLSAAVRKSNEIVLKQHPVAPSPYTLMSLIPQEHKWFSVIDLKHAFWTALRTQRVEMFLPLNGRIQKWDRSSNIGGLF